MVDPKDVRADVLSLKPCEQLMQYLLLLVFFLFFVFGAIILPFSSKEVIFLFRIAPNNYANNLNLKKVDQVIFSYYWWILPI